jgi:hypothetical protein
LVRVVVLEKKKSTSLFVRAPLCFWIKARYPFVQPKARQLTVESVE